MIAILYVLRNLLKVLTQSPQLLRGGILMRKEMGKVEKSVLIKRILEVRLELYTTLDIMFYSKMKISHKSFKRSLA